MKRLLFFKQKTTYDVRISNWSSDVCSSDLSYHPSPCRLRIGARDVLQRGQQMTVMLAVMAVAAAEDRALVLGSIQAGLVENRADLVIVVVAEGGDIGADAALRDRARDFIHLEQFGNEAPIPAEAVAHPLPALLGEFGSASCRDSVCQYV